MSYKLQEREKSDELNKIREEKSQNFNLCEKLYIIKYPTTVNEDLKEKIDENMKNKNIIVMVVVMKIILDQQYKMLKRMRILK